MEITQKYSGLVFDGAPSKMPYFTFAVTPKCNLKCSYCCEGAENHGFNGRQMPVEEIIDMARLAFEYGIRIFRITGGEPTTWPGLTALLEGMVSIDKSIHINLNSNGTLPERLLPILKHFGGRLTLRVSIDRIAPNEFTPKALTPEVGATLRRARAYAPLRINTVVTRSSLSDLPAIIDFCKSISADLKLLDLYYNRDFFAAKGEPTEQMNYWWHQFVPIISTIGGLLTELGFRHLGKYDHGGYGIPLPIYANGDIAITIKDSTQGTHFHDKCNTCPEYRCQEGLYSPMLSYDGTLHVSECRFAPYMFKVAGRPLSEKREALANLLTLFRERSFSGESLSPVLQSYLDARSQDTLSRGPTATSMSGRTYQRVLLPLIEQESIHE